MKKFKVEFLHAKKEYAAITVVAKNQEEAIQKSREIELEKFDESEKHETNEVKAIPQRSFYDLLISLFRG